MELFLYQRKQSQHSVLLKHQCIAQTRYLDMALKGEDIRIQDVPRVMAKVAQNPVGTALAWTFFRARWNDIKRMWVSTTAWARMYGSR